MCRPSGASDRAAQRAYQQIDAKLKQSYDYDTGHQRYAGGPNEVVDQYREVLSKVPFWFRQLEAVTTQHPSKYWEVACKVRIGSLYDSPATGLTNVEAPALRLYEPQQEEMLRQAEASDMQLMQIRAQDIRKDMEGKWTALVEVETTSIYRLAVRNYAEAIAQSQGVPAHGSGAPKRARSPELEYAVGRYTTLKALLGHQKMLEFTQDIEGFVPPS